MRLGDAFSMTTVKATGEARIIDASIKDPLDLLTDVLFVEGDFRVPEDPLRIQAGITTITRTNLHTPNNSTPDSGLTAPSVVLTAAKNLQVGGWIRGSQVVNVTVADTVGDYSIIMDAGSQIVQTGSTGTLSVVGDKGLRIAGSIRAAAAGAVPVLAAATVFEVLGNADLAVTGAGSTLNLTAGADIAFALGSVVRAGVTVAWDGGAPSYTMTGAGSEIVIDSPKELHLGGLVVTSGGLNITAGTSSRSHADEFAAIFAAAPDHYMATHDRYSILLTGTIAVLGENEELVLSGTDDVVLLGNVSLTDPASDLTVQSDVFVYIEGRLRVPDKLKVLGGIELDGSDTNGADSRGSSVYLGSTGVLNTTSAGSSITLRGSQDVDIRMPLVAGGQITATGIAWAGEGSVVTITSGQQIYLDAPIQAAAAITLSPGTPAADDQSQGLVITTASGLNTAGLGANNTGSAIRMESPGDLEIPVNILSGGSIVQTFGPAGQLLAENYVWSGRDSIIEIVAGGRVLVGTDTVDASGNPIRKGSFLRASARVSISAGSDENGAGIIVYANGGVTTSNNSGSILLDSDAAIDLDGYVVSGGEVNLVQNEAGETTGYSVTRHNGDASLNITSDRQIRIGKEVYASRTLNVVAGVATPVSGVEYSGIGLLVAGSGSVRSGSASTMTLTSASGIQLLAANQSDSPTYSIYAAGTDSNVILQPAADPRAGSQIRIENTIFASGNITIQASPSGDTSAAFVVSAPGKLESAAGNVNIDGVDSVAINGSLLAAAGAIALTTDGDVTIGSTGRINASSAVSLTTGSNLQIDGTVGGQLAPEALTLSASSGTISVNSATGRLTSARSALIAGQTVYLDGTLQTAANTADTDDYEVKVLADTLRLKGSFEINGSLEVRSVVTPEIYNFTATASGPSARVLIVSGEDLNIGRLTLNEQSKWIAQTASIKAERGIVLEAPDGNVVVSNGSALTTVANNSSLVIRSDGIQIIGILAAGAEVSVAGTLTWTGTDADISLVATEIALGGMGVCPCGIQRTRGGSVQASGDIIFNATGDGPDNFISLNSFSFVGTLPPGSESLPAVAATPSISLLSDGNIELFGLLDANGAGGDLLLDAAGSIKIDTMVTAADSLTISSRLASGISVEVTQLTLWTNAQGQLLNDAGRTIDRNGNLIDAAGRYVDEEGSLLEPGDPPVYGGTPVRLSGGTLDANSVSLTSSGNVNLLGQTGDLYFDGTGLASRTGSLQTRVSGSLRVSGRHQTSGSMDVRGGTVSLLADSVLLSNNTLHILGNELEAAGFVGSTDRIAINAVQSMVVTGLTQAGNRINVAAGVSPSWTLTQLTSDTITRASLTAGTVSVEESGVLDATDEIRVVSGGNFDLSANAIVSPNLTSISEPIIIQTERTIDVVTGTRQVPDGTVQVDVVNWVPTQVTEAVGSNTVRVGRRLSHDGCHTNP
jgi:hypothetical protein